MIKTSKFITSQGPPLSFTYKVKQNIRTSDETPIHPRHIDILTSTEKRASGKCEKC